MNTTDRADRLLGALARAGVRHAVVSPGSRSTPLVLAAATTANLQVHSVLDERAAAFFALGLSRAEGVAPLLICTSGSAPAHYLPAVVEADADDLPLLLLSADRPTELIDCGAPQTVRQTALFADQTRWAMDLSLSEPTPLSVWTRIAYQAFASTQGPRPGPVHLNLRVRKPLAPEASQAQGEEDMRAFFSGELSTSDAAADSIASYLTAAERPAVVVGPSPILSAKAAAERLRLFSEWGFLVMAEASSQLRLGRAPGVFAADAFDLWLRSPRHRSARPDVVLEIGSTPTSTGYAQWVGGADAPLRLVAGTHTFRDPSSTARVVSTGSVASLVEKLARRMHSRRPAMGWRDAVHTAEGEAWAQVEASLPELSEGSAVRAAVASAPEGVLLAIGNSLPIRHLDRFVPGGGHHIGVVHQRGASGIDGFVASAAGLATGEQPVLAICGDITFWHDVGSLRLFAAGEHSRVLLVIDNGGGRIFDRLPSAEASRWSKASGLFSTSVNRDLGPVATGLGLFYAHPRSVGELRDALGAAWKRDGASLIHVSVAPESGFALERRLREAVGADPTERSV